MEEPNERPRAAIFVDDGGPDAFEFATNYVIFDPSDPQDQSRAWADAEQLWHSRNAELAGACAIGALRLPELTQQYPILWEG